MSIHLQALQVPLTLILLMEWSFWVRGNDVVEQISRAIKLFKASNQFHAFMHEIAALQLCGDEITISETLVKLIDSYKFAHPKLN
ncbi:hypothetical protein NEOLEDRAFT_1139707 [Neolentinus lepideus HHB14362 ss-1]|uniref:Uncharacterized protein n=1 Tax=Neolentinus lepideus HHB14362 ss-1 TaxID=1314782 RepID=A0A165PM32_9AGAM|nr:hypothetical protein NEOLEDRAFT_1139707 [Neolentinus lepideus HHB14362 ss-1]